MKQTPDAAPLLPLDERHRQEFADSGITDETIAAAGVRTVANAEIREILGWQPKDHDWGSGWAIPFDGGYSRIKLDHPRSNGKGKVVKYESPKGAPNRAFFPPNFKEMLLTGATLVVAEGEKKCLAISQLGYAAVGLLGVWAFAQKRPTTHDGQKYGKRHLIADLEAIAWREREVVICFDSDAVSNPLVSLAEWKLAEVLRDKGAKVRVSRLPQSGDDKTGADDFIVSHGPDAFRQIIGSAKPAEKPEEPAPMFLARAFLEDLFVGPTGVELKWHRDELYRWDGRAYSRVTKSELTARVLLWLDGKVKRASPRLANDVTGCLQAETIVPFKIEPPVMIVDDGYASRDLLSMRNGMIDLNDALGDEPARIVPHTAKWFSTLSLPYNYQPDADCPTFFSTLDEIFDGDAECIDVLGEWFGYCLTQDTSYHAILLLEGPPRSGKGTILRAMQHVIGEENCASPRLMSLGEQFGLAGLVGKRLAICPDAHLGHGDKAIAVLETLKAISGEDAMDVNRKFLPSAQVRLRVKFALAVNELPKFGDGANALASRVLILPMRNSFVGREDRDLEGKLQREASGIFMFALEGLRRLRENRRFTVPEKSAAILKDFARLTSPIHAFIEDVCEVGNDDEYKVRRDELWDRWKAWCGQNGNREGSLDRFGTQLRSLVPHLGDSRPREEGLRVRYYTGLRIKP